MVKNILSQLKDKIKYLKPNELVTVKRAIDFAGLAHDGQKRLSGDPYFRHPLEVASAVADLKLDADAITAAVLHDTVEDTGIHINEIKKKFGGHVAQLVDGITKLGQVRISKSWFTPFRQKTVEISKYESQIETLRKMFVAMSKDLRVILIKLADRTCNLQTLSYLSPDKQKRIAQETMDIYAPIAGRLGIGEFHGRLEDAAFSFLEPAEFKNLRKLAIPVIEARKEYLGTISKKLLELLAKNGINCYITYRAKTWYSLYRKLLKYDRDINKIYDIVAMRVIVPAIDDCYNVLGLIHSIWRPLPGRIKDYIALPKPNGYQSIHTTIFADNGVITEIQIRTGAMNEQAEFGVAAHWYYSEKKVSRRFPKQQLAWVRELAKWQTKIKSATDLRQALKLDFFKNRIFVFTPKGDVIDLPQGATPIDFAYAVHSDVGNQCHGSRVNGKYVNITSELNNGDVVDIVKKKKSKPNKDWLNFVKTEHARSCIKKSAR
ncbi:MAG TPA: RelA/SpoT family protein [Patescibacteria group bacterium]|nr:RelA/SpoT family protein [Patescibacteria group bacterium]